MTKQKVLHELKEFLALSAYPVFILGAVCISDTLLVNQHHVVY